MKVLDEQIRRSNDETTGIPKVNRPLFSVNFPLGASALRLKSLDSNSIVSPGLSYLLCLKLTLSI
jgi:hypothetical protein